MCFPLPASEVQAQVPAGLHVRELGGLSFHDAERGDVHLKRTWHKSDVSKLDRQGSTGKSCSFRAGLCLNLGGVQ